MQAIQRSQELYTSKLAVLRATNMSEVQMEYEKERAKLEILKEFKEKGLAFTKKEVKKGFSLAVAMQGARAVSGLMKQLGSDLMDAEVTTEQAFTNMAVSAFDMIASTLMEFILAEGIKQAFMQKTLVVKAATAATESSIDTGVASKKIATQIATTGTVVSTQAVEAGTKTISAYSSLGPIGTAIGIAAAAGLMSLILGMMSQIKKAKGGGIGYGEGLYKKFASGGFVSGGVAGKDSIPALLMPGEYVLPVPIVDAIRSGTPPPTPGKYAFGGSVSSSNSSGTTVVFSPHIQTIALPTSVQNMRYFRDTVTRTQGKLAKLAG